MKEANYYQLKDVTNIINGGTPKTKLKEYWDGNILWITPKDLGKLNDVLVSDTPRKITSLGLAKSSAKLIKPNSIILSTRAPIGHLAINKVEMTTNQGCRGIEPNEELDVKYLFYFLKSSISLLNELGKGTTFKELSTKSLGSVKIRVPFLEEQRQIVQILDQAFAKIDQAIANIEQNIQNAEDLFQSKLNQIFSQQGEGWSSFKLGDEDFIKIEDGDRGKNYPKKKDFLQEGFCVFLNTGNVRKNGFDFEKVVFITKEKSNLLRKGKLKRGDVVMTTRGTIGNLGFYNSNVKYDHIRINSGMLIFRVNENKIKPEFIFKLFQSPCFVKQIKDKVSGAAQPQLPIKTLVKFQVPYIKNIEKQDEIVDLIKVLELKFQNLHINYKQKLQNLEDLKKSLLEKAFSGELTKNTLKWYY